MFEPWKYSTTIGNYGWRLHPESDVVDFPAEFGDDLQIQVGAETLKFRWRVWDTISWDEWIDDLLAEMWLNEI